MVSRIAHGLIVAAMTLATAGTAVAQASSTNEVATKTDWSVFEDSNPKECWAVAAPKETVNTREGRIVSVKRSDILLMAFYRPGSGVQGQLAFTGGYNFASGVPVTINIDGADFNLFTQGEWAWTNSAADDAKIITAMKRGRSATVTGLSQRSRTTTKDTFSLSGFTAAIEEAQARCK
ncbi:invasion associated locus B family protein [Phaeobacter sp. CNT1-3]|jgi:hypothetical protein|nr:invasion associated locus B family protein [Phaeobacter sp. CNT1-3]